MLLDAGLFVGAVSAVVLVAILGLALLWKDPDRVRRRTRGDELADRGVCASAPCLFLSGLRGIGHQAGAVHGDKPGRTGLRATQEVLDEGASR
ncbi:hypothetical protein XOC_2023 [Xanthomonas oryzae pv. oryzicola BLS256]|uniref:Uncharacterized protein n=1 Tax=Xanthomonas oryzae pv. oryzicola (strain BLS256) TaxID=383407 RepID=G7TCJ3_XANOB|nr:hypothetical protein XOC_2023 [Xanthomonas oryzae pv. oryzicola BLS256]AJQ87309.1 hypothetical protein BE73_09550 [Xanthomonas oryzae pv. oryzicola]QEO97879.1 hypothetical protein XOCgx_2890 [Xanthomonas oryzae pv. oryzicola]